MMPKSFPVDGVLAKWLLACNLDERRKTLPDRGDPLGGGLRGASKCLSAGILTVSGAWKTVYFNCVWGVENGVF